MDILFYPRDKDGVSKIRVCTDQVQTVLRDCPNYVLIFSYATEAKGATVFPCK